MIKLLADRVLIKELPLETKRNSGIFVAVDSSKENILKGTVITVGPGKDLGVAGGCQMTVKPEDVVYYSKFAGSEITIDEQKYQVVRESDIIGII